MVRCLANLSTSVSNSNPAALIQCDNRDTMPKIVPQLGIQRIAKSRVTRQLTAVERERYGVLGLN